MPTSTGPRPRRTDLAEFISMLLPSNLNLAAPAQTRDLIKPALTCSGNFNGAAPAQAPFGVGLAAPGREQSTSTGRAQQILQVHSVRPCTGCLTRNGFNGAAPRVWEMSSWPPWRNTSASTGPRPRGRGISAFYVRHCRAALRPKLQRGRARVGAECAAAGGSTKRKQGNRRFNGAAPARALDFGTSLQLKPGCLRSQFLLQRGRARAGIADENYAACRDLNFVQINIAPSNRAAPRGRGMLPRSK